MGAVHRCQTELHRSAAPGNKRDGLAHASIMGDVFWISQKWGLGMLLLLLCILGPLATTTAFEEPVAVNNTHCVWKNKAYPDGAFIDSDDPCMRFQCDAREGGIPGVPCPEIFPAPGKKCTKKKGTGFYPACCDDFVCP
ncbi:uncharacterized protein LOC144173309 [Haemaphysalis longicornis]